MEQTLTKVRKTAIFIIALIFVCFHIYTSAFGLFEGMSQRNIHLTLMLLLVVLFKPSKVKYVGPAIDALLIVAILVQGIYMFGAAPDMAYRAGTVYTMDKVGCTLLIILILVSTKRVMGWAMPIIGAINYDGLCFLWPVSSTAFRTCPIFYEESHFIALYGHGGDLEFPACGICNLYPAFHYVWLHA